jgi:hypothetical protein
MDWMNTYHHTSSVDENPKSCLSLSVFGPTSVIPLTHEIQAGAMVTGRF